MLKSADAPHITCDEGWKHTGWTPNLEGVTVRADAAFCATYRELPKEEPIAAAPAYEPEPEPEVYYTCHFDAGTNGTLSGADTVYKREGSELLKDDIPTVNAKNGYTFEGWNVNPLQMIVNGNMTFRAVYKRVPWYKRFWLWLTSLFVGRGCLKRLLWLLLILLGLWLLMWLLRGCHGCSRSAVSPVSTVVADDGRVVDDNGIIKPITGSDGELPTDGNVTAPILGDGRTEIPIIEQPGTPSIIANRLFLFIEDEADNVETLAKDFKAAYADDKYSIIGYDKEVKLLVIQIPEDERDQIRKTINGRLSNHRFLVFDEEIYEMKGTENTTPGPAGWHLEAIGLKRGWETSRGSADVRVAIVDDGIDASHPIFGNRIVEAYNVFLQSNELSMGDGHGTHTAALAAGSDEFYTQGAAGVAPECTIIPVQVFDNGKCPLSALISGIMYSIHHDADVVNISIAPSFAGLNALPIRQQEQIANNQFKNVEKLWKKVCNLATQRNCILVFAAGNDDILSSIPPENRNNSSIVVGAVDVNRYPTVFTNYGTCTDISSPGKGIVSAMPGGKLKAADGTSMAAPIVTGTIALMKTLKKDLTTIEARNCLYTTGADVFGWMPPLVQVDKALEGVKNGTFDTPKERHMPAVPDGVEVHSNAGRGRQAVEDMGIIPIIGGGGSAGGNTGGIVGGGTGDIVGGVISGPGNGQTQPTPSVGSGSDQNRGGQTGGGSGVDDRGNASDETDYYAIRRLIKEYKQKIVELERMLPKN